MALRWYVVGNLVPSWRLIGLGIRMNVMLFLFNVFFPMYPADGSKLLTVGLQIDILLLVATVLLRVTNM